MRNIISLLFIFSISISGISQNNPYFGIEFGGLFDRYHYENDHAYSENHIFNGGSTGIHLGYRMKTYTFEVGTYWYFTRSPYISYDFVTGEISPKKVSKVELKYYVIPFRLGKEIQFVNTQIYLKPEIGFSLIVLKGRADNDNTNKGWGIEENGNSNKIDSINYYTFAQVYEKTKLGMALETNLSIGYRFKEKFDIYLRGSYLYYFSSMYEEDIVHHSPIDLVIAERSKTSAILMHLGVRIKLPNKSL